MSGFFKVPRSLYDVLRRDPNSLRVYLELSARARWSAGTCLGSHGVVDLDAGQCVIGRAELAKDLEMTDRTVRTSLERLSRLGFLTVESSKRGTVITVRDDSHTSVVAPTERPSIDSSNDQASSGQSTDKTTTSEDVRKETVDQSPLAALAPVGLYDPESPFHRGKLATTTYGRFAAARDELIAELGLRGEVPMPRNTFAAEPAGFRDLRDRIRAEGAVGPQACDRVFDVIVREARETKSVEWLSDKAFTEGAWRRARNGGGGTKQRAGPRRAEGTSIGAAAPRSDHPVSQTLVPISEF